MPPTKKRKMACLKNLWGSRLKQKLLEEQAAGGPDKENTLLDKPATHQGRKASRSSRLENALMKELRAEMAAEDPNSNASASLSQSPWVTWPPNTDQDVSKRVEIIKKPSQARVVGNERRIAELAAQVRVAGAICECLTRKTRAAEQEVTVTDSLAMATAGMFASSPVPPYQEAARLAAEKAYEAKYRAAKLKEQEEEARTILEDLVEEYNRAKYPNGIRRSSRKR